MTIIKQQKNAKLIFDTIKDVRYDETDTFDRFINSLGLTKVDYIHVIQCTLSRTTILLQRKPSDTWTNSFAQHIPATWIANTNSQFVLNSYVVAMYCSSYMTKEDRTLTLTFRSIRENHIKTKCDIMNTISSLRKALLNKQQMSAKQVVHIVLSLPLNSSSRRCIFINTSPMKKHAFVLKNKKDLEHEPNEFEDIMCPSIIEYYILCPTTIDTICLA